MKNLFKKIVSIGLAATMALGMAVTSFAADEEEATTITFYSDEDMTAPVTEIAATEDDASTGIWLAGSKKAVLGEDPDETTDLSQKVIYTDAEAPEGGKVLVGVTKADAAEAPVSDGKITKDAEADAIVKASYKAKDSSIVIKSSKSAGEALVWVVVINKEKEVAVSASIPVTVSSAASKISFYEEVEVPAEEDGEATTAKKTLKSVVVPVGESETISFEALGKDKKVTDDASYTYEIDEKFADNIEVTEITGNSITVKAVALDKDGEGEDAAYVAKVVKAKVTVICKESGKKASLTVSVTNPVTAIEVSSVPNAEDEQAVTELLYTKDVATISIDVTTAADDCDVTTDKVKIYVAAPYKAAVEADEENGIEAEEGIAKCAVSADGKKVVYTKSKAVTAKLSKDGTTITLVRNDVYEEAEIFIAYTDAASKEITLMQVAFVERIVATEGDINLASADADATGDYAA